MRVKRLHAMSIWVCGIVMVLLTTCFAITLTKAQGLTGIKVDEFVSKRPIAPIGNRRTGLAVRRPTYKTAEVAVAAASLPNREFAHVGITLWRFRPSTTSDRIKELIQEEGNSAPTQWTLERTEEGTLLTPGQKVRVGIESLSRDGFLYVINREEYADGSLGNPSLVFPTKLTPQGTNQVEPGKMVYIPRPPNYCRIKPSSSSVEHTGDVLTIVVSAKPLIRPSRLSNTPMTLPKEQVESWEKQWAGQSIKFEMEAGAGRRITEKEQEAALADTPLLSRDDPPPQTIYRLAVKPEDALVVRFRLKYSSTKATSNCKIKHPPLWSARTTLQ